ncbi:alpha/beta hydrolase [Geomicrobium sp. JCM 19037]|uniref:alpha/beta hydrolase n=1 Tax=Geomicrobium sp. JCM 19037 TaxID=1460634 RepID=UPI0021015044|nr:alpha/beta fold hydrolase [Geomicrobium sp. JCM 19037]
MSLGTENIRTGLKISKMNEHSRLLSREYFLEHPNTYREYYELPADVDHELQRVLLNGKQIAFQYFFPEKCEQFVLFLHGFMDHVGPQGPFIHRLVNENIGVLAIDFPGHGLSEGDRYHIDDFNRYEEVLEEGLAQLIQRGYGDLSLLVIVRVEASLRIIYGMMKDSFVLRS